MTTLSQGKEDRDTHIQPYFVTLTARPFTTTFTLCCF